MKQKYYIYLLMVLFAVALGIRVFKLGAVPAGMTDDELREAFSAHSIMTTGRSLSGEMFPFLFIVSNFSFNPVPIYSSAIFTAFDLNMFTARLPYALAGFFALVGTYYLAKTLTEEKWIAFAAVFCMTFNVWAVQLSRMAYEAVFAQMFYIWGTLLFLRKRPAASMILFFLAFNSYDATKLLYIPLVVALCWYRWKEAKRAAAVIIASVLITFGVFVLAYYSHPHVRGSQFTIFQDVATANQVVASARNSSLSPDILKSLFHNKITYFADVFFRHYLYTFSMEYLFLNQEASGIYSMWLRGNFYILELPLLILGALHLFTKNKRTFSFSAAMILIGAIPAGIGPEPFTYATRASFVLPWIVMFIGTGIVYVLTLVRRWRFAVLVIAVLYAFSIIGYFNQYYFEWSRNNAVYYSKGVEDLARYLSPLSGRYSIEVTNVNDAFLLHWAFVTKTQPRNVTILPTCRPSLEDLSTDTVYAANPSCNKEKPDHLIFLPDGTPQWAIYRGRKL